MPLHTITLVLVLAAINVGARERPPNHQPFDDNTDPSYRDALDAVVFDFDEIQTLGDMDMDWVGTSLDIYGIPQLRVKLPSFTTYNGDHGCSYSYEIETDPFPLTLRPTRYILYRFPDINSRTAVHGIYHIKTEQQCLPSIHWINSEGQIIRSLGRTEQVDENVFKIEWRAGLDKEQRLRATQDVLLASEDQARTHMIVLDVLDCHIQILEMKQTYLSAAPLECQRGAELNLNEF